MVARMKHVKVNNKKDGQEYTQATSKPMRDHPRVNYYHARMEPDPCPDPLLLDSLDESGELGVRQAINSMLQQGRDNGVPKDEGDRLFKMVVENIDVFRVSFSHGPPALIPQLRIALGRADSPLKLRLRNYLEDQRRFLQEMTSKLVSAGMTYRNLAARWPPLHFGSQTGPR